MALKIKITLHYNIEITSTVILILPTPAQLFPRVGSRFASLISSLILSVLVSPNVLVGAATRTSVF